MKNPPRIQLSSPDSLPTSPAREPTSSSKPSSIKASKQSSLTQEAHSWRSTNSTISNVLPRHKKGGATNLVSVLANAMLDSVPLITITGQEVQTLFKRRPSLR
ncbi:unnamed protein product [Brassica rapa subsp. trilocularis]